MPTEIFGPNTVSINLDGMQPPEHFPFGTLTFDGGLGPAHAIGDDLWIREETKVRMHSANPTFGNYFYNEIVNYRGSFNEVNDPEVKNAAATIDISHDEQLPARGCRWVNCRAILSRRQQVRKLPMWKNFQRTIWQMRKNYFLNLSLTQLLFSIAHQRFRRNRN